MTWSYDVICWTYPLQLSIYRALLSPASESLSSLDSKLRHSAYAHLRVARAQCVYGFSRLRQPLTTTIEVVPATTIEGMRKVKHLTVNATVQGESDSFYWALVYVPQGTVQGLSTFCHYNFIPGYVRT